MNVAMAVAQVSRLRLLVSASVRSPWRTASRRLPGTSESVDTIRYQDETFTMVVAVSSDTPLQGPIEP